MSEGFGYTGDAEQVLRCVHIHNNNNNLHKWSGMPLPQWHSRIAQALVLGKDAHAILAELLGPQV
jgi:hypothetical protein